MKVKICLLLIVKDESHIISECLNSVYESIDYWCISDTGSSDNTCEIITEFFKEKNIPGELFHDQWVDFAHNRTLNFQHAEKGRAAKICNYMWVIDADDKLTGKIVIPEKFRADEGLLKFKSGTIYYPRPQLFKIGCDWSYISELHEMPICEKSKSTRENLDGDYYIESRRLGARSLNPLKYYKDGMVLWKAYDKRIKEQQELQGKKGENVRKQLERIELLLTRYAFYMGQSFRDYGDTEYSEKWYTIRSLQPKGKWDEECYQSRLELANNERNRNIEKKINKEETDDSVMEKLYMTAFNIYDVVLEPYYYLVEYFNRYHNFEKAYFYADKAKHITLPNSNLYLIREIYEYKFAKEYAYAAFKMGKHHLSYNIIENCLYQQKVPVDEIVYFENIRNLNCNNALIDDLKKYSLVKLPSKKYKPVVFITNFINLQITTTYINSFLKCCLDYELIAEWIIYSSQPQPGLQKLYPFIRFIEAEGINVMEVSNQKFILFCESNYIWIFNYPYISKSIEVLSETKKNAVQLNMTSGEKMGKFNECIFTFDQPTFFKNTITENEKIICNRFSSGVRTKIK